jgi:hypothetical protein
MENVPLEKDIQNSICDYLELKHHFFWRQNTSPTLQRFGDKAVFRRMSKYSKKGVPDILCIYNGIFYGIEVKRPGGKQSEDQIKFEKESTAKGAIYSLVTSIDDVMKIGL